jgi:TonB family protein
MAPTRPDDGEFITVISLIVGVDGRVHDPKVTKPLSSTKADANAIDAVRRWKFKPATKDGVSFAVRIIQATHSWCNEEKGLLRID